MLCVIKLSRHFEEMGSAMETSEAEFQVKLETFMSDFGIGGPRCRYALNLVKIKTRHSDRNFVCLSCYSDEETICDSGCEFVSQPEDHPHPVASTVLRYIE